MSKNIGKAMVENRNIFTVEVQVDRQCYFKDAYCSPERFVLYACQIREIIDAQPESVLEVGPGTGIVTHFLGKAGIKVNTLDIDQSLTPDFIGSVTNIPLAENAFDITTCFEVLEHLPFTLFPAALIELRRVTRRKVLLSVPDRRGIYNLEFNLPILGHKYISTKAPLWRPREHRFDGQHYWEINRKGFLLKKIQTKIWQAGFKIEKTYQLRECPRFRIFVLDTNKN